MLINHLWIYVDDEAFGCFRCQSCHQLANAVKGQRLTTVLLSKLSTAFNSCQTCLKLVRAVESFQRLSKLLTACNRFVNIVRFNLIFSNSIHFLSIAEPNQGEVWQIFHHSQSLQREECLYDVKEVYASDGKVDFVKGVNHGSVVQGILVFQRWHCHWSIFCSF